MSKIENNGKGATNKPENTTVNPSAPQAPDVDKNPVSEPVPVKGRLRVCIDRLYTAYKAYRIGEFLYELFTNGL